VLDHSVSLLSNNHQYESTGSSGYSDRRASDLSFQGSTTTKAAAVFTLGLFNLSSQPALHADLAAHLVLRMVQRSRGLVQAIVAGSCTKNPVSSEQPRSLSTTPVAAEKRARRSSSVAGGGSSGATIMHELAEVVGEKERNLISRLSYLTGGG
jgi:hypothetical protein